EATAALEDNRRDGALLALRSELSEQQKSPDLADVLRQRAAGSIEATERAHLKMRTALLLSDPLEQEQLLSEALADNPGDAAAIALHARLVTQRDPGSAAERFIALGEALETHAPDEAAAHYLEAGVWHERAGGRAEAAALAQLSQALEARADSTSGSDAADLLVEASELARAAGNDVRSTTLLRKARGVDPGSSTARNALLALSTIPSRERIELLQEEARHT